MPRSLVDDFLDGLADFARDFVQERIDEALPKPPRAPRARRATIKPPKAPKTPKPPKAKRERAEPTLYQVLGVDAKAEPEVIEAAWKAKARLYHPDLGGERSTATMKAVNHAHDTLSDTDKRKAYDRLLRETR